MTAQCPHGDAMCPCPNDGPMACAYEGQDAWSCPNPPHGFKGLVNPHCHVEGCDWYIHGCAGRAVDGDVHGECGLVVKLGVIAPLDVHPDEGEEGERFYSMAQARPGSPGWPCGWLRTPLNVANGRQVERARREQRPQ